MARKYEYHAVIQQHYGQGGWEDVSQYGITSTGRHKELLPPENSKYPWRRKTLMSHDLEAYRLMGYPTRVIKRRTKIA